jgi:ABC-type polysaccharide/polyol phosphate transport system ATPase subunit
MENKEMIKVEGVSKIFEIGTKERMTLLSTIRHKLSGEYPTREVWALKNINFTLKKGEMAVIVGPNGAGKTTLLRILAGIMFPTSGKYEISGQVSCIFDLGIGFNPRFSAIDNVYMYGALLGISRKEVDKKLPEIVEFSELGDFMGAKLSEFSSGMRSRLAFSTIVQTIKDVVMVDEVLAVGDASFQRKCMATFENLLNQGKTIIYISHSPSGVKKFCNKALYINHGNQVAFGGFEEVTEMYANNNGKLQSA